MVTVADVGPLARATVQCR